MRQGPVIGFLLVFGLAAALTGCGTASRNEAVRPATVAARQNSTASSPAPSVPTEPASDAADACKRAVYRQHLLSTSSKSELSIICENTTGVVSEDHHVMQTVCKEVAYDVAVPKESARPHVYDACYKDAIRVGH